MLESNEALIAATGVSTKKRSIEQGRSWSSLVPDTHYAPAALVVLITIGLIGYFRGPICPDVSGQFWLAHAMRHGSRLYTDLIEINPPLWFWMAMPIDWLAEILGMRTEPLTIMFVSLWVLGAMRLTRDRLKDHAAPAFTLFLLYMAIILLVMPLQLVEQREHLALIGAVPWLVFASRRRQGRAVPPFAATVVGVAAALGLSLKPYFLAVPILTEAWLALSLRRNWRPLRYETAALAGTGALYVLAIILFAPRFFTDVLPRLFPVYQAGGATLIAAIDVLPLAWLFMLVGIANYRRQITAGEAPLTVAFLLGFVGFVCSYLMQHRGYLYQGLPATGCLALALAAAVMELGKPINRLRLFLPAMLLWPLGFVFAHIERPMTPRWDITPAFSELKRGDAFGLISTIGATTWPKTVDRGLVNASRYGQYWMIGALDTHPGDPLVWAVNAQAVRDTVLDFRCLPPKIIVFTRFDRRHRHHYFVDDPFVLFMKDPGFAELLSHYRLSKRYGVIDVYSPATPLPPIDRRFCRRIG